MYFVWHSIPFHQSWAMGCLLQIFHEKKDYGITKLRCILNMVICKYRWAYHIPMDNATQECIFLGSSLPLFYPTTQISNTFNPLQFDIYASLNMPSLNIYIGSNQYNGWIWTSQFSEAGLSYCSDTNIVQAATWLMANINDSIISMLSSPWCCMIKVNQESIKTNSFVDRSSTNILPKTTCMLVKS